MQSKLTLIAYENHMKFNNTSLFSDIVLPTGYDREQFIDNILLRAGEFECVYNEPLFMKQAITLWSKNWKRTFERWLEVLDKEKLLNPLENYDRYEDISVKHTGTTGNTGTATSEETDKVSAFNTNVMQDSAKANVTNTASGTRTDNLEDKTIAHLHGNIGVTTSSQLLTEALEVARFNLYNQIADCFIQEFCILIY